MVERIEPGPGQESVWDYPRPPLLEACELPIEIVFNGVAIAQTQRSLRVLETSHPPVYYIPPEDIKMQYLIQIPRQTFCEWKGLAGYYSLKVEERTADHAAWFYPVPSERFAPLKNYVAFYAEPMDRCILGGETVQPQPGNFYGGWITSRVVGPFKSGPGRWISV